MGTTITWKSQGCLGLNEMILIKLVTPMSSFHFQMWHWKTEGKYILFNCKLPCLLSLSNGPQDHVVSPGTSILWSLVSTVVNDRHPHAHRILLLWWKYFQGNWTAISKDELSSVSLDISVKSNGKLLQIDPTVVFQDSAGSLRRWM